MISVIVPYWNAEDCIGRCVDSLRKQKGDFEFILVNDKSSDDSEKIAKKLADERFVFVDNKHNKGVGGARNTGLDAAKGEWITFVDADDELNDGAYAMFMNATRIGKYGIYQFNHYRYYDGINKTALKYTNPTGEFALPELPIFWCVPWNKLYSAELLKGLKFDETMQLGEDEMFNLSCLAKDGRICCVNGITTTRHFDAENRLTKTRTEKDVWKLAENLTKFTKKSTDPKLRQALCMRLAKLWSGLFMKTFGDDDEA